MTDALHKHQTTHRFRSSRRSSSDSAITGISTLTLRTKRAGPKFPNSLSTGDGLLALMRQATKPERRKKS